EVRQRERVELGKLDAVRRDRAIARHDDVLAESDVTVGGPNLLEPRQAMAMGADGSDDIGEAITVDIGHEHLGAALIECEGMAAPFGIVAEISGLFPPTGTVEEVGAAVAVEVAPAKAVVEAIPLAGR